ncbi:flavin-containing monooxygenase [Reinekea blandensis]|uniref:Monooxygenase domain protein n=1 Tax=Reinekea blandensis MED297 TaxID=314283 RepID=A4BBD8_9GAMM|nr:NAD(P)/FAD-dependent oxidoreductase [Reinekea blandensis]EAR10751.1 monooxygenase domain protein [Reinekea sp. MED297] [Reinekea blandensis MED297]
MLPYAIIGAGPMGLCTARRLSQYQILWIGFESHTDVGGLWDIDNPTSTMYHSAHLISSKTMTEFHEFPMDSEVPTYPAHHHLKAYFQAYARRFGLYEHFRFNHSVIDIQRHDDHWRITTSVNGETQTHDVAGVLLANGTLHHPNRVELPGEFTGKQMHAAEYKSPSEFKDKRVLIIGCGNSGCDIAVDAVHQAASVDMSVRRGYYFLPKFIKGRPTDTLGGKIRLPKRLKQLVDGWLIRMIIGKPSDYGLPDPDYRLYESHPVINSIFLHYIGHGDINPQPDIQAVNGQTVTFSNGQTGEYDLILEATGYKLNYPFIAPEALNWQGFAPQLYLNVFNPMHNDIYVMGMVEAAGLGWQGRDDQAHLVALYLRQKLDDKASARALDNTIQQQFQQRAVGGMDYLPLERMAYYVDKQTYLSQLHQHIRELSADLEADLATRIREANAC